MQQANNYAAKYKTQAKGRQSTLEAQQIRGKQLRKINNLELHSSVDLINPTASKKKLRRINLSKRHKSWQELTDEAERASDVQLQEILTSDDEEVKHDRSPETEMRSTIKEALRRVTKTFAQEQVTSSLKLIKLPEKLSRLLPSSVVQPISK